MSASRRSLALRLFVPSVFLALASCGGGGGGAGGSNGGDGGDGPGPASATRVLVAPSSLEALEDLCGRKGARVVESVDGTDYYVVEVPDGEDADEFLRDLEDELEVEDVEHDAGTGSPEGGGSTVPLFLGDDVAAIASQPALTSIGVPLARARGYDGSGVLVAVIDTGITASPALLGKIAPGGRDFVDGDLDPTDVANGIDDDRDGLIDEGVGHGTFVASLILAVAPGARILPLRALDSDAVGTASAIAQAITYATNQGAQVINLSAGLDDALVAVDQAIAYARARGVFVDAAAGNRATSKSDYPARLSSANSVTSIDAASRKAPFASWDSAVDLCAPGVDLIGAHPAGLGGTARWSGTSFSTALVTGAFALLAGHDPATDPRDLWRRLQDTAISVDAVNPQFQGKLGGRIDLGRATSP